MCTLCLNSSSTDCFYGFRSSVGRIKVLRFGLSMSTWGTKVVEGAFAPLWEVGIRILNYKLCDHRDLSRLGLRVNWKKSKLSPVQRISFLGMELDSVNMTPCLTNERAQLVMNCLSSFRGRTVVPLKQIQRLLGHMAAVVTPLRLFHMRPLQHWLHN